MAPASLGQATFRRSSLGRLLWLSTAPINQIFGGRDGIYPAIARGGHVRSSSLCEAVPVDVMQVARGCLRWLPADEGGLREPFAADRWVRPAWIEPGDIEHVASLVLENIRPAVATCEDVKVSWLAWELLPASDWTLREGDELAITEGTRPVAFFTVERIEEART